MVCNLIFIYHNNTFNKNYVVTHINQNNTDNRIENLKLIPKYIKVPKIVTKEFLQFWFTYKEGKLYRKYRAKVIRDISKPSEVLGTNGHYYTNIGGKIFLTHRLIYIYHHDYCSKMDNHKYKVYHIDGDLLNNKIKNLELVPEKDQYVTITKEYLNKIFIYNNGKLIRRRTNKIAGGINKRGGYQRIHLNGKAYPSHRLIYIYHYGDIPDNLEIDHINRIKDDNRIENLRLVTSQENMFNRPANGYCWNKKCKKWKSDIVLNGKKIFLGLFDNKEDARKAYLEAKKKYHNIKDRRPHESY